MAAISCQQTFNNSRQVIIEAFNRGDIGVKQAEAGIATAAETYRRCTGRGSLVGRPSTPVYTGFDMIRARRY